MFDLLEILKRFQEEENAPTGVIGTAQPQQAPPEQQQPQQQNLLSRFLPQDEDKREALSMFLLNAGAGMMAAGGPSTTPMNTMSAIGQGLGVGAKAYAQARNDASSNSVNRAKVRGEQVKLQQAQQAQDFAGSIGNGGAFSIPELRKLYQQYLSMGEYSAANTILERIQRLDDERRKDGMVQGPNGDYEFAGGVAEGANEIERQKGAGRVEGEELFKKTDDIREYELYTDQEISAGRSPQDFTTWSRQNKKSGSTQVNVGGNSDKFKEKSDETAAKRFDDIAGAGAGANQMVGDMDLLIDLGRKVETGKGAEWKAAIGPYAEMAGVSVDGLNEIQAYQAVVSRIAPNLRPAGSGATSDFDAKQFLLSIPSIGNTRHGNEIIASTMQSVAQNKIAAAQVANRVQRGELTWQDGDKEISALPNPYKAFKDYKSGTDKQKDGNKQPAQSGAIVTGSDGVQYRFKGGDRNKKENWEPIL